MPRKRLEKTFAYVIPMLGIHIERVLQERKSVLVKYLNTDSLADRFRKGTRIVFYESRGQRRLLGEAMVSDAEMLLPMDILSVYGKDLFLTEAELEDYVQRRPNRTNKKVLMIKIENAKRYPLSIEWDRNLTMAGEYIDEEQYKTRISKRYRVW